MAEMTALARIVPVAGLGMATIRADLSEAGPAIAAAAGVPLPGRTAIAHAGRRSLGWMSPDELLLTLPLAEVPAALAALGAALEGRHALLADVSDMRVCLDVLGAGADDVLAKLSPTDLDRLPADALRRSRAGQVAAAFWRVEGGWRIVAFRSVGDYLHRLLEGAAAPGSWLAPR